MNEEEILYKAKNSKSSIFFAFICSLFIIGFAIFIQLLKLKYFSRPFLSLSSTMDWVLLGLVVASIWIVIAAIRAYFSDFLGIAHNAILIKMGTEYKKISFGDIELIKKYVAGRYSHGSTGKAYTLIKMKNGTEVFGPNISNLKEFTNKIKTCYPLFNNYKGIVQGYDDDIRRASVNGLILLLFAMYCTYKIFNKNIQSIEAQVFIGGLIILYIWAFSQLAKLITPIKNRYFSEETKMMLASIKASEKELEAKEEKRLRQLKEQEEESIVTNYCPICGSRLIDFKCNRCEVSLDNIYDVKKFYCINCGTKREDLEPACLNCDFSFNL